MRKLILAVAILLLCLPVSADAKHRKRHAQRRSARTAKAKPAMNTIERRQLLDAATTQELLNELSHRWLSQFTLQELQAALARREQKPK